jgi:predicted short-subunit dehydrogenase-like oxidoreductase (DUF2520 family)
VTTRSPNTFVVGAGPVATALAGALRLGGVPVLGLWARTPAQARSAGAIAGVAAFSSAPPDLLLEADLVLVAVRDSAIGEVASMLLGTGLISKKHVLLHCSGAFSSAEAFKDIAGKVGGIGTLHPLRAIADGRTAMRTLKGTIFGVEGDEAALAYANILVGALGGKALALDGQHMPAYHAACAFASNYVVAVLDAAVAALGRAGLGEQDALAALIPLAQGALANVAERGLAGGLTGPIRRGDELTVARHLEALSGDRDLVALYEALARRTVDVASRIPADAEGPDAEGLASIRRRLGLLLRAASGE